MMLALGCGMAALAGGEPAPVPAPAPAPAAPASDVPPISKPAFDALRAGKLVVMMRHAATNKDDKDQEGFTFDDCAKQRNLNEKGREQAKALGATLNDLGIPVGEVLTSPMCRAKETAQIAFGKGNAKESLFLETAQAFRERQPMLGTPTKDGNRFLVCHVQILKAHQLIRGDELPEGGAVIVEPRGKNEFAIIGQVQIGEWEKLRAYLPKQ